MKVWTIWEKSGLEPDYRDTVLNQYVMTCIRAKKDIEGHVKEQPPFLDEQNRASEWEWVSDLLKVMHLSLDESTSLLS